MLQETTVNTVTRLFDNVRFVELERREDAYADLLIELWDAKETFGVVEQDVVPHRLVPEKWGRCRHLWCGFGYPVARGGRPVVCLGCTRFASQLMVEHPAAMQEAASIEDGLPAKHWQRMDGRVAKVLFERGVQLVEHVPPVRHLHDY